MKAESATFTITIDNRFLEANALITERDGMVAENRFWRERGEEPHYTIEHFREIAAKMRALKTEETKPAHSTNK
jgi:hypothetical protein